MNGYTNGHADGDMTNEDKHVIQSGQYVKLNKEKSSLLASISSLTCEAQAFAKHSSADKNTRYEVRTAALALADSLENPVEQALRIIFESAPPIIGLRIAFEGGFLNYFGEGETQTADALSKKTGADRTLIGTCWKRCSIETLSPCLSHQLTFV